MKALVDASALLLLVKHADTTRLADIAADLATLDLAGYEAGDGVWKQVRLLKSISEKDARATHDALVALLSHASIVRGEELDHTKAMDLAVEKGIAYYDACYIIAARTLKLPMAQHTGDYPAEARWPTCDSHFAVNSGVRPQPR